MQVQYFAVLIIMCCLVLTGIDQANAETTASTSTSGSGGSGNSGGVILLKGACEKFSLWGEDKHSSCTGKISYNVFKNGVAAYVVFLNNRDSFVFSGAVAGQTGSARYQVALDQTYFVKKTDKLGKTDKIVVKGQCELGRTANKKIMLNCNATAKDNKTVELAFRVDDDGLARKPRVLDANTKKQIANHCDFVSRIGRHYVSGDGINISNKQQIKHILNQLQKTTNVKYSKKLESMVGNYVLLLSKISDFKPATRAVYLQNTCLIAHTKNIKIPLDQHYFKKINTLLGYCENASITQKVLKDCVAGKFPSLVVRHTQKSPKPLGSAMQKKIISYCGSLSEIGQYYGEIDKLALLNFEQMQYILLKIQEKEKSNDAEKLQENILSYLDILNKTGYYKPATYAAYVRGACKAIYTLEKEVPDDAESQKNINTLLSNCENDTKTVDQLRTCIDKKLPDFVMGGQVSLQ